MSGNGPDGQDMQDVPRVSVLAARLSPMSVYG